MPTGSVVLGETYKHDQTGEVMRAYAASVPELDNHVRLIEPDGFGKWTGFYRHWTGTWDRFQSIWSKLSDVPYVVPDKPAELPLGKESNGRDVDCDGCDHYGGGMCSVAECPHCEEAKDESIDSSV